MRNARSKRVKPMPIHPIWPIALVFCAVAGHAFGTRDPSALCDDAAHLAAQNSDTPITVLLAITRVETGRNDGDHIKPWPWTLNHAGKSHWFDTEAQATDAAESALIEGTGNLDIGCFQLNHRWHGENFSSLDQMLDPRTNARYAAAFLADLYRELGDWPAAIAAYHSRSAGPAATYLEKIGSVLADLGPTPAPVVARQNTYPLLQTGPRGKGASLVPQLAANRPLIGSAP